MLNLSLENAGARRYQEAKQQAERRPSRPEGDTGCRRKWGAAPEAGHEAALAQSQPLRDRDGKEGLEDPGKLMIIIKTAAIINSD